MDSLMLHKLKIQSWPLFILSMPLGYRITQQSGNWLFLSWQHGTLWGSCIMASGTFVLTSLQLILGIPSTLWGWMVVQLRPFSAKSSMPRLVTYHQWTTCMPLLEVLFYPGEASMARSWKLQICSTLHPTACTQTITKVISTITALFYILCH